MSDKIKKQEIKEMADVIEHLRFLTLNVVGGVPSSKMYAEELYSKGWRKHSDVERLEAEIETLKDNNEHLAVMYEEAKEIKIDLDAMRGLANSYKRLYDTLKKEHIELINGISVAKEKQAKKILDEVERIILDNTYPDFDVKHKPINVWRAQEGYDSLAELKKEYTGGGSDKCCEDCKFFNTYRKDQPCCSCYDYINFESDVEENHEM